MFNDALPSIGAATLSAGGVIFALSSARVASVKERVQIEDRTYRLHYNASQARTDILAGTGMLGALAVCAMFISGRRSLVLVGAAGVGSSVGIVVHVASSILKNMIGM